MSSPGGTSWLGRFAAGGGLSKPAPPPPPPMHQQDEQQHAGAAPHSAASSREQPGGGGHPGGHQPPTPETQKRVDAAKTYIENLYRNQAKSLQQRMDRRTVVENEALPKEARAELIHELEQQERKFTRLKRAKISVEDFEPLTIIGRGAFGEVRLVRDKSNGQVYAMKKLRKTEMVRRGQVDHVNAERNLLAEVHNESVVKLFYSFQVTMPSKPRAPSEIETR